MNYNIDELNLEKNKIEAIECVNGPMLIIAGPGSGKTKTLVEKVVYLLVVEKINPEHVLVSTFTEKASRELISRISDRLIQLGNTTNVNDLYIGTMHSIFLRLLEDNREYTTLNKNYRVLDSFDLQYLIYKNIRMFDDIDQHERLIKHKLNGWAKAELVIKHMSKIGEEGISIAQLQSSDDDELKIMAEFYSIYRKILVTQNVMDFTYIQTAFLELLENNAFIAQTLSEKFRYILIDEYQDTNTIQEKILFKLLSPERQNICVVGDDDQGLYRFRGATVRNILTFTSHFPTNKCKIIRLETNYRSHPDIIAFYNNWMEQAVDFEWGHFRYQKTIKPPQDKKFHKHPAVLKLSATNNKDEWECRVHDFIRFCESEGIISDYNQICFLFRSVKSDRVTSLINSLTKRGISVFAPRSDMFFSRSEIMTAIGLLMLIFRSIDNILLSNNVNDADMHNYYSLCRDHVAKLIRSDLNKHEDLKKWLKKTSDIFNPIKSRTNLRLSSLLYECFQFSILSNYLDVDLRDKANQQRAAFNLALLSQIITKFEANERLSGLNSSNLQGVLVSFFGYFLRFLKEGGLEEYEDFDLTTPAGSVSFMTVHQAKGLEFPITIVGSMEAVPRKQYTELDILLEDKGLIRKSFEPLNETKYFDFWRLYYTAFSRAKNLLILAANETDEGRKVPSKYFNAVYSNLKDWTTKRTSLNKLRVDNVVLSTIKKEYSYTGDIISYEHCPLFYKFFRAIGFSEVRVGATLFGALVHETIEDVHKAVLRGEQDTITNENIEHWFNSNYNNLKLSLSSFLDEPRRQLALEQVLRYKDKNEKQWDRIMEVEVMVSLVKSEYILKGKIDLIRGEKGMIDIIDFKSDARKPDVNDPSDASRISQYRRQLEIYAHILEERYGLKIDKLHLYYTSEESGNPQISWNRENVNIPLTIETVDGIIQQIEAKNFDNTNTEKCQQLCGNCDMRYYCKFI
jgi:DNA helicase-2/ATP-dependent DNA helicase PcrA